jgi:hypothetical protein
MTHPITPPPELVEQWEADWHCSGNTNGNGFTHFVATRATQWGADQELEACCEWLASLPNNWTSTALKRVSDLRAARRPEPKQPSLKEQALALLDKAEDPSWDINDFSIVRKALEQIDD